jgi:death-on-curing protein
MRYLEGEEVLVIHAHIIDETGGLHGVRDMHLLASLIERPKMQFSGKDLYLTVFDKAAAYFESCALHHSFVDGNKRTAIALATRSLYLNGYELSASNLALERFVIVAVTKKYELKGVSVWLKKNSIRLEK